MKNRILGAALAALLTTSAIAQVNVVPQIGLNTANLRQNTYGAISIGLVPAASATDIFCISGSATKTIKVNRISLSGTAGTAVTTPVVLLRRTSLDTGGTPATGTALPVAGAFDSSNPTASAVLTAYTANPTIVDSSPTYLAAPAVSFGVTTTVSDPDELLFGTAVGFYNQPIILRGAAQQVCLNLNAVSISSGVLAISIQWTEE
jgi:FtsH-binding integral membrane protein